MKFSNKSKRPFVIFYILAVYVFLSFSWWSYLLLEKNWEAFDDKAHYRNVEYNSRHQLPLDSNEYFETKEYVEMKGKFNRQKWMIIGEGGVFLLLLASGVIYLWRLFSREMELSSQQNNFLLSITHELKSPLASIKLTLQTFIKRLTLVDNYRKLLHNSLEDVDRLDGLVENILLAAKIEGSSFALHKQEENISEIVHHIVEKAKMENHDKYVFHADVRDNIYLMADKYAMTSAITNLLDNAIKYSYPGSKIEVSLRIKSANTVFEIRDEGIGIPEKEFKKVFKKFYRVGNEETRKSKGTGLGLFIVKKVTDAHGGKVEVSENNPKGTVFRLVFSE